MVILNYPKLTNKACKVNIPLLDLKLQHCEIQKDILLAVEQVICGQNFILGEEVEKFESRIASYCGSKFAIGVSSGTDALLVSLMALGVKTGDEVITTTFSFIATAGAIARVNAKPVFVDIDPTSFNISPELIKREITSKTKVIIPVHLFGQCAEMKPILELGERYGLPVIEDAAQAIGAEYRDGKRAGNMGTLGCFSFFPSKNLGAFGDGGMVITNDWRLAEKVKALRVHGSNRKYYHKMIGGNFRLDSLQAAVLNVKVELLNKWILSRQKNARMYVKLFVEKGLSEKGIVALPDAIYFNDGLQNYHTYNQFAICVPERDELQAHLKKMGISSEVYYPKPFHLQECFEHLGYGAGDMPEAERVAKEILALPIYPGLKKEHQDYLINTIHEFYKR